MTPCDVIVVGGGPAGCSAAIHLARSGREVVLVDKASFPRDKCCGDGLTTSALRQLESLGLEPSSVPSWRVITHTTWCSPSGYSIDLEVPSSDGVRIATARRTDLDAALLALARSAGVRVLESHMVSGVASSNDGVAVTATDGNSQQVTLAAPFVVAADGMWSTVRKLTGAERAGRYLGDIHAFRQYFTDVDGPAADRLWVTFEPDLLPAYFWSFPSGDGCVNAGFGLDRRFMKNAGWMKQLWPELLNRPHIREMLGPNAKPESAHKAWPIPASIKLEELSTLAGRVLFAGDAARVVDPLTGEGIGQALETGALAATAILRSVEPEVVASAYRRSIKYGLKVDHEFARWLTSIVRHDAGARAVIRLAPAGPWHGQYALRWVFEDNPRAGLLTPWRWGQRFKKKTGAFA